MKRNTAILASTRFAKRLRSISSHSSVAKKLSHSALSYASPTEPIEGRTPIVYVDGARAIDTCILESLRTQDVESVELYPMGFTSRPGYASHAHGLILVFLLGATQTTFVDIRPDVNEVPPTSLL